MDELFKKRINHYMQLFMLNGSHIKVHIKTHRLLKYSCV